MKSSTVGIVTPINKDEMSELLKETKETLATELLKKNDTALFTVVNMWKVRKSARTSYGVRRRSFN